MREDYQTWIREDYVTHHGCRRLIIGALAIVLTIVCLFLFAGCRTAQHIEQLNISDSVIVQVKYDTVRTTINDTAHIEVQHSIRTSEGTTIEFGEGGGTYNSMTGEAANVRSVHEEKSSTQHLQATIDWRHQIDSLKATVDSLNERISCLQSENQELREASVSSGWHSFLVRYFFVTAILMIIIIIAWLFKKFYLRR